MFRPYSSLKASDKFRQASQQIATNWLGMSFAAKGDRVPLQSHRGPHCSRRATVLHKATIARPILNIYLIQWKISLLVAHNRGGVDSPRTAAGEAGKLRYRGPIRRRQILRSRFLRQIYPTIIFFLLILQFSLLFPITPSSQLLSIFSFISFHFYTSHNGHLRSVRCPPGCKLSKPLTSTAVSIYSCILTDSSV